MASTGQTTSEVVVEQVGIRCPIGDCKVLQVDPFVGSDVVAGQVYAISNMVVVALKDCLDGATDRLVPCAYEIPKLAIGPTFAVKPKASETWTVGTRLGFKDASDLFLTLAAGYSALAYVLEAKAANASECLIHFKGDAVADVAISST